MKKLHFFIFFIGLFALMLFFNNCSPEQNISYIGKSRDEIIAESVRWQGQFVPGKITIGTASSYYHFNNNHDIFANDYLMKCDVWCINYHIKRGWFDKLYFFEIKFKDNVVVSQEIKHSSDAI